MSISYILTLFATERILELIIVWEFPKVRRKLLGPINCLLDSSQGRTIHLQLNYTPSKLASPLSSEYLVKDAECKDYLKTGIQGWFDHIGESFVFYYKLFPFYLFLYVG